AAGIDDQQLLFRLALLEQLKQAVRAFHWNQRRLVGQAGIDGTEVADLVALEMDPVARDGDDDGVVLADAFKQQLQLLDDLRLLVSRAGDQKRIVGPPAGRLREQRRSDKEENGKRGGPVRSKRHGATRPSGSRSSSRPE